MQEAVGSFAQPEAVNPPAIPIRELWPWALFAAALVLLISFVAVTDSHALHEFFHDGRHLLAVPCH
jgi:cobalt transporter subunit CbtB